MSKVGGEGVGGGWTGVGPAGEMHDDVDEFPASPTALAAPFPVRQLPLVVRSHVALVGSST